MTDTPGETQALTWAWTEQKEWSHNADQMKKRLFRFRTIALTLIVIAAAAGTAVSPAAGVSQSAAMGLAWLAAAAAATVAVLQTQATRKQVQDWTRVRSVSEAFKAEIYTYLAGVAPYTGPDKVDRFMGVLKEILADVTDLERQPVTVAPPEDLRPVTDVASYTTQRVDNQIDDYYRTTAHRMAKRARQFRAIALLIALAVAILSAAVGTLPNLYSVAAALPVLTTIAAVITAEMAFRHYDQLALEYDRTADQLQMLKIDHAINTASPTADAEFVKACESVISTQNQAWMARRTRSDATLPSADPGNTPPATHQP